MKIDRDTHDDVVQLIQEEMEAGNFLGTGRSEVPERLASLIEGRLCIETPKEQWEWEEVTSRSGLCLCSGKRVLVELLDGSKTDMSKMAAAPELAQWMYEYAVGNMLSSGSPTVEPMTSLIRLLQKAGVDL